MNLNVVIDWKFVVALGAATVGTIFASKMDGSAAERVSIRVVDACKEAVVAGFSDWWFRILQGHIIFGLYALLFVIK